MNPLWATIPQCPKLHGQWGLKKPSLWPRSCWQVLISRRWKMLLFEQLNGSAGAYFLPSYYGIHFLREIIITIRVMITMMRHKTQGRRIQMRKKGRVPKSIFFCLICCVRIYLSGTNIFHLIDFGDKDNCCS